MRRLVRVKVDGLLGRFSHDVDFPADWEFLIIHGPNGIGKTKFLELISAVFSRQPARAVDMRFRSAQLEFSDGVELSLERPSSQEPLPIGDPPTEQSSSLVFELRGTGTQPVRWVAQRRMPQRLPPGALRELERTLPVERAGPDMWYDRVQGDYASLAELADRYLDDFPFPEVVYETEDPPEELQNFLSTFSVRLIETQRLVNFEAQGRTLTHSRHRPQRTTVLQYSKDLAQRIAAALAENSRRSQDLDKSFPRRVLFERPPQGVTDEQIRSRYTDQLSLRGSLAEIDVLDPSAELDLPDRNLEDWERRVLWTYLEDAERKLTTFDDLSKRVRLLREIINSRFQFKQLYIDGQRGFVLRTAEGEELPANVLSSGEQHELVLLYDLLFNAPEHTLVLIDEPEISLHVAWQREFLNDIRKVAELASLRFLVATHSPQIIDRWVDRARPLMRDAESHIPPPSPQ